MGALCPHHTLLLLLLLLLLAAAAWAWEHVPPSSISSAPAGSLPHRRPERWLWSSSSPSRNKHKKRTSTKPRASPAEAPSPGPHQHSNVFSVLSFDAKGDGKSDDTEAFQTAWLSACQSYGGVLLVPKGYTFLVGPILFAGPCQPHLVFQVDGTVQAPRNPVDWRPATQKLLQWLEFAKLHSMSLQGSGLLNGLGEAWWNTKNCQKLLMSKALMPVWKINDYCQDSPTGVRFYSSVNVTVRDLTMKDSPQVTLKFDDCSGVTVDNVTISTPATSPNTDGIHLQNTRNAVIQNSDIGSGDDCVSIQTGCSDVRVREVRCGPGHGISIGALGAGGSTACVANITVENVRLEGTQNGVRIKTWPGGSGSLHSASFTNISVTNVANPIIIDQFYCHGSSSGCKDRSSAVQVSHVSYSHFRGTYAKSNAVYLACSNVQPCVGLSMLDIQLQPAQPPATRTPASSNFCINSYGSSPDSTLTCLLSTEPSRTGQADIRPNQCDL